MPLVFCRLKCQRKYIESLSPLVTNHLRDIAVSQQSGGSPASYHACEIVLNCCFITPPVKRNL